MREEDANYAQANRLAQNSPNGQNPYGYPSTTSALPNNTGQVTRLRPAITDRQVHLVAGVLLEWRHAPMGELELARLIIDRLDDLRYSGMEGY